MKLNKTIISQIGILCLVSMITLLTLVSCGGGGSDDLGAAPEMAAPQEELVPITFNGYQGNETAETRANSGTPLYASGVTRFHVWGYKNMSYSDGSYGETQTVFPRYQVDWRANSAATSATNTNNWEYVGGDQTIKFWDWSANAYRFFAATKFDKNAAVPATVTDYAANKSYGADKTTSYEVSMLVDASPELDGGKYAKAATDAKLAEAPYFSRLWFSTGDPTDYPDKQFGRPVTLEFIKPFARVRFIYNYVYPREGVILSNQKFRPSVDVEAEEGDKVKIPRRGVVTVSYPLSGAETKESYSMTPHPSDAKLLDAFTEDYDPEVDTKVYTTCDGGWYTVLPNTSQGSYTLTVNIKGLGERKAVVPATYMQWKAGYSYTYIFKITEEGGVAIGWVDYAVVPWVEMIISTSVYNW